MKPTTDDVLKWAREVGFSIQGVQQYIHPPSNFHITDGTKKVAALAYAAGARDMQERCAKVCEGYRNADGDGQHVAWYLGVDGCVEAIRALGDDDE
jgi:formyltetrahydrofolate synthetase